MNKLYNDIKNTPLDYKNASVIAKEAGLEMLTRLDWMTLSPKKVLDLGCGMGEMSVRLQKYYPTAYVFSVDHSEEMLNYAKQSGLKNCIHAEAETLPFPRQSIDLIFANFLLPWCAEQKKILQECRRVMHSDGLFMLTTLGLDTLKELKNEAIKNKIIPRIDMHDLGDLLLQSGFSDPVLDVSYYTVTYKNLKKLAHELQASGILSDKTIINQEDIELFSDHVWAITYEIITAHAFAAPLKPRPTDPISHEIRVKIPHLPKIKP